MGKLLIGIGVIFALMGVFGSMIPLVILGVVVALVGEKLGEKKQNEVKEQLGDQVICEVLHDVFQDVEYQMQGHTVPVLLPRPPLNTSMWHCSR